MDNPSSLRDIQADATLFRSRFKSVILATATSQADVNSSYAPFVLDSQNRVYVFISALAKHTRNLLANPQASLLWIEDEQNTENIFARKRLALHCSSASIDRDTPVWSSILDLFETTHGETVSLLKTLNDFQLIRFEVHNGTFVRGFGKAVPVYGNSLETDPE
ncbi:MAG: pyridoxamine 5'-phosphate oxidase family protein [Gammaproteobacteria bacterium]|nr:pyridoxamine 5'-phosphate oxidase family protein [Gammaproteobacteria bacterium]